MKMSEERKEERRQRKLARIKYEFDLDKIIVETSNDIQRSLLRFQNKAFNTAVKHLETIQTIKEDARVVNQSRTSDGGSQDG